MTTNEPLEGLTFLLPQKTFLSVYDICKKAIKHSDNHPTVRKAIVNLLVLLRANSRKKIGVDSADVLSLMILLENTSDSPSTNPDKQSRDVMRSLTKRQITEDRLLAAEEIRLVWIAFGRILGVVTSHYGSTISKSRKGGTQLTPLDIMSDKEITIWTTKYQPWYKQARKTTKGSITNAQLVLDCLLHDTTPEIIDKREKFRKGTSRRILLRQLDIYMYGKKYEKETRSSDRRIK